ncbi:MAG: S8 family peptidase [Pseudomonadota bacterium]
MAEFELPHLNISNRVVPRAYQAPRQNFGGNETVRIPAEHGSLLRSQLERAFAESDQLRPTQVDLPEQQGSFLEVQVARGKRGEDLERKKIGIHPGASKLDENDICHIVLYVPTESREAFYSILDDYRTHTPTEDHPNPPRKGLVESIDEIRRAQLESFWTDDPEALPTDADLEIWWELWCFPSAVDEVITLARQLGAFVSDSESWMRFPESTVVQVLAKRPTIELLLYAPFGLLELRRASISPSLFMDGSGQDQRDWSVSLAERTIWPDSTVPAVCLLDTGVNRGHVLIEPALSAGDQLTIKQEWNVEDDHGHGTQMAGLALHGDLTTKLSDEYTHQMIHRLESVKLLPPNGFEATDPRSYGWVTQAAVSLGEINEVSRQRVFCCAITNEDVSGSRPSSWSAAIDQCAAGVMPADEDNAPRRLFILSCGNIAPEVDPRILRDQSEYPVEDPSQAWNALTVGGFTNKSHIDEEGYEAWRPYAQSGDVSPYSRTSQLWPAGKSPFKPDIVMEAGNRGISPTETELLGFDSLSLLTTNRDVDRQPLTTFWATSAATALASRLAARILADNPDYWPETVRALIVHSAQWTPTMLDQLNESHIKKDRHALLRRFGYGVPSYERAHASSQNNLALVAQNEIQPYKNDGGRKFGDCHIYDLPWPRDILEQLGDSEVTLKVTLSYFIEPNPGYSGSVNPQRYQSYGLRFDLKRGNETREDFIERVNALERDDPLAAHQQGVADDGWTFGQRSVAAGSLHCDEWSGTAVKLANRDLLCIKPVGGWWRDRASLDICQKMARYALVLTISTPREDINLYTEISNIVDAMIELPVSIET